MIAFPALPVSVQPVPPCDDIFKILLRSGSVLQTGKGFRLQFPPEFLPFRLFFFGIFLKGMFCGIGFQIFNKTLLFCKLPLSLLG